MTKETLSSEERFMAAVRLEKPDRVPVAPMVGAAAAATLLGETASDIIP